MSKTSRSQAISHGIPLSDARAKRSILVELFRGRERRCRCLGSFRDFRVRLASAAISSGNDARVNTIFYDNLRRWSRGEDLINEARSA